METLVVPNPSTPPAYGNVGNKPILSFLVLESDGYVGRYCFVGRMHSRSVNSDNK